MRPDTLPPDFYAFMLKAARCPKGALELNALNVRGAPIRAEDAIAVVKKLRPTQHALDYVNQLASESDIVTW
jgi:hypothetical protein